jgi:hypothetical protein
MAELLVKQNKRIKEEADTILHEKRLLEILNDFGKPYVSGSYALDLMTWRDLDIYLETDLISEQRFFHLEGSYVRRYRLRACNSEMSGWQKPMGFRMVCTGEFTPAMSGTEPGR